MNTGDWLDTPVPADPTVTYREALTALFGPTLDDSATVAEVRLEARRLAAARTDEEKTWIDPEKYPHGTMTIPVPLVAPLGQEVNTRDEVQMVWDTFVKPDQDNRVSQSIEMRYLMAILRAVNEGMPS